MDHKRAIRDTISILDQPDYAAHSNGKAYDYLSYMTGARPDEVALIRPVLFRNFATRVLGFDPGVTLYGDLSGGSDDSPRFVPADRQTHPFVFDTKGSDVVDLVQPGPQGERAIHSVQNRYWIMLNMRAATVYEAGRDLETGCYDFSFSRLYTEYRELGDRCLDSENTRCFLRFVAAFAHRELSTEEQLKALTQLSPWTGKEELRPKNLRQALHRILRLLVRDVRTHQTALVKDVERRIDTARQARIEAELFNTRVELGYAPQPQEKDADLKALLTAPTTVPFGRRALRTYHHRVAWFALIRILLVRFWGDHRFMERNVLYGDELRRSLECRDQRIEEVLREAFSLAGRHHAWLFTTPNNYTWYQSSPATLTEVLHILADFPLQRLDHDVLGTVYEEMLDRVDKKTKGQYYSPAPVVRLIWDLVGYDNPRAMWRFEHEGLSEKRQVRKVFDPATGSGRFLSEAIRRLRLHGGIDYDSHDDIAALRTAVINGFRGAEISPFAYVVTEANLLIQLTPVIKQWSDHHRNAPETRTTMGVVQCNALRLHTPASPPLSEDEEARLGIDHAINPRDVGKEQLLRDLNDDASFSYCCANPPYIREDDHKELFRQTLERFPYWKQYYRGKMDYLYFFIILGLSKLEEGGRLGFITTSYWLEADGAQSLREYVASHAVVLSVVFFDDVRLFRHAPGQTNMVFVLERRCSEPRTGPITVVHVKGAPEARSTDQALDRLCAHISEHADAPGYDDELISVFISATDNEALAAGPWSLRLHSEAAALVERLSKLPPLGESWSVRQGIVTGADRVSSRNLKLLSAVEVKEADIGLGQGIFCLTDSERDGLDLSQAERGCVKPLVKASDIRKYVAKEPATNLLYVTKDTDLDSLPAVGRHLKRFRPILEHKRECQQGKLPWFSLHWPREESLFDGELIACSKWPASNEFAYAPRGLVAEANVYLIKPRQPSWSPRVLLGFLNSEVMAAYFALKISRRGRKYFLPKNQVERLPIPHYDPQTHGDVARQLETLADQLVELTRDLDTQESQLGDLAATSLSKVEAERLEVAQQQAGTRTSIAKIQAQIDKRVRRLYGVTESELAVAVTHGTETAAR